MSQTDTRAATVDDRLALVLSALAPSPSVRSNLLVVLIVDGALAPSLS